MSHNSDYLNLPSLAQQFDAPENFVGHFGWLCGYSADAVFLSNAAERFTRLTSAQRSHQGRIALAIFLDPGNLPITLLDAPGVAHLPIKDFVNKPFCLLHAKVAVLGFRHQEDSSQWRLRLIVSTGNWTRQTLEESLDLAWCIDVSSEILKEHNDEVLRCCADIKAAHALMKWIGALFDCRLLGATPNGHLNGTKNAEEQVNGWVALCSKRAKGEPRFFDSRNSSLLGQLSTKIKACSNGVARNYLAMGSGFYESAKDRSDPPKVPGKIVDVLKKELLLTKAPEVDLYVNRHACQAVAFSVKALKEQRVKVRQAAQPPAVFGNGASRTLHAKFLFGANYRENSNACNSAWVYLGSGNLTSPGFANKMSVSGGNLEAGVVFTPDALYWRVERGIESRQVVTNLLPVQWDDAFDSDQDQLSSGSDMPERDDIYLASPIAWLAWHEVDGANELRTTETEFPDIAVLDPAGNVTLRTATGFVWQGSQPRQVRVRWEIDGHKREADIPVVDQYGRIAATELPKLDIVDAWWQLADFPMPPDDVGDGGTDDGDDDLLSGSPGNTGRRAQPLNYPIRQMMELVESIAAKQTDINEVDWALWCNRLEQTLIQAKESPAVKYFHRLKLNPLSPLRAAPFRPPFAETSKSMAGQLYEDVLTRIEKAWAVDQLDIIGGLE